MFIQVKWRSRCFKVAKRHTDYSMISMCLLLLKRISYPVYLCTLQTNKNMDQLDFFNLFEEFCHKFLLNGTNITSVFQNYKHNEIKKINLVFVVTLGCFLILPCVKRSIHWHGNISQLFTESLS